MAEKKQKNVELYEEVKKTESATIKAQLDNSAEKKSVGRPSSYTEETASKLCSYLSMGQSLRTACKNEGMPSIQTVFNWIASNPTFLEQYTRAKEEASDALVEDMLDIADETPSIPEMDKEGNIVAVKIDSAGVARNRLRVETRKWIASKLKPKKYGDVTRTEITGKDGGAVEIDIFNSALEELVNTIETQLNATK